MKRKIERMHELFGTCPGQKCKDCEHLLGNVNEYRKCKVYGVSSSEATDWALKYDACGLWNKPYKVEIPIVKLQMPDKKEESQIDGQMELFGG